MQAMILKQPGARVIVTSSSNEKLTGREGVIPTSLLMAKQARIQGLIVGHRRQQQDLVRALEHTAIRPVISDSYGSLSDLPAAFKHQQFAGHFGKITLEW